MWSQLIIQLNSNSLNEAIGFSSKQTNSSDLHFSHSTRDPVQCLEARTNFDNKQ